MTSSKDSDWLAIALATTFPTALFTAIVLSAIYGNSPLRQVNALSIGDKIKLLDRERAFLICNYMEDYPPIWTQSGPQRPNLIKKIREGGCTLSLQRPQPNISPF